MHYSIYIGRVGALAVALGVGFAIGNGIAWADETGGTGSAASAPSKGPSQTRDRATNGADSTGGTAGKRDPGPRSAKAAAPHGGTSAGSESRDAADNTTPGTADAPRSEPAQSAGSGRSPSAEANRVANAPNTTHTDLVEATAPSAESEAGAAVPTEAIDRTDSDFDPVADQTAVNAATGAGSAEALTEAVTSLGVSSTAETTPVPQMFAAPDPANSPPEVPLTLAPGLWRVIGDDPAAVGHPMPAAPSATAAVLSLQWMRREAERAASQQAPAALSESTSLTVDPVNQLTTGDAVAMTALAEPTAVVSDDTAALQASFDALRPGDTLVLEPRTYYYSDVLYIRQSNVNIEGNGATLYSTDSAAAAVVIQGNDVTLQDLNLTAPTGQVRADSTSATRLVFGGDGNVISDVTITGGASAGVYITGASNFLLERVTVQDTAADGVQITNGSHNGVLNNVTTLRTGDDGIAIVSYQYPANGTVHDITINNPVVDGSAQRGLVVTGGERITFNNVNVSNTALSGVWIGSQPAPFYTQSVTDVTVNGGTLTNTNSGGLPLGAVAVVAQNPDTTVSNVTIENLNIVNTPPSSYTNVGLYTQGGTLSDITFRNIAIWQPYPTSPVPFYTNAPAGTYIATGFTVNGVPVNVAPAAATM